MRIRNPAKNEEKNTEEHFFDLKLQFTYVQATGEAFIPQKRTSSTSKFTRNMWKANPVYLT
jgi:hypothetical protein